MRITRFVFRSQAIGLTLLLCGLAGTARADADAQAKELFRLSGLERQLGSIEPQVQQGMAGSPEVPEEVREAVARVIRSEFSAAALGAAVLESLETEIEPDKAKKVLDWLRAPLGRKVVGMEEAASTPEGVAGLQRYAQSLPAEGPDPRRLQIAQRLDAASGGTDLMVDTALAVALAVSVGVDSTQDKHKTADQLKAEVDGMRARVRPMMNSVAILSYLYAYRDLPDTELEQYVEFLKSDVGQWYTGVTGRAWLAALSETSVRLGEGLKQEIDALRARRPT